MKFDRRLLIALAVAAVALLAVPALAFAAVWKDKGVNVTKFVEIGLAGGEIFETTSENGMSCEIKATLATEGGGTGEITKWKIEKCPTGFGSFAECELLTAEAKGLPWTVDVNASDLTITNMRVKRTFNAGCPTTSLDKTIASTTVTLDSTTAITEMEFKGEIREKVEEKEVQVYKSFGSLAVEGAASGTYGIG